MSTYLEAFWGHIIVASLNTLWWKIRCISTDAFLIPLLCALALAYVNISETKTECCPLMLSIHRPCS